MDSLPPPPPFLESVPPPSSPSYGPGDIYPNVEAHASEQARLCDRASSPDWLYLSGLLALDVGAFYVEAEVNQTTALGAPTTPSVEVRLMGPAAVGLAWGATLGGGYLALPKCDKNWVSFPPREGNVRATWPLALTIAGFAGISAPMLVGTVQGPMQVTWTTEERVAHLLVAGGFAVAGALLPYIPFLSPKTWRAARELEHIRASVDGRSAYIGYTLSF